VPGKKTFPPVILLIGGNHSLGKRFSAKQDLVPGKIEKKKGAVRGDVGM
jgi:hypothetical protein